jgi:hypothetical protein
VAGASGVDHGYCRVMAMETKVDRPEQAELGPIIDEDVFVSCSKGSRGRLLPLRSWSHIRVFAAHRVHLVSSTPAQHYFLRRVPFFAANSDWGASTTGGAVRPADSGAFRICDSRLRADAASHRSPICSGAPMRRKKANRSGHG